MKYIPSRRETIAWLSSFLVPSVVKAEVPSPQIVEQKPLCYMSLEYLPLKTPLLHLYIDSFKITFAINYENAVSIYKFFHCSTIEFVKAGVFDTDASYFYPYYSVVVCFLKHKNGEVCIEVKGTLGSEFCFRLNKEQVKKLELGFRWLPGQLAEYEENA